MSRKIKIRENLLHAKNWCYTVYAYSSIIIYVPGGSDMLSTSQSELPLPSTGSWLPSRLSSTWRWAERIFPNWKYAKKSGTF